RLQVEPFRDALLAVAGNLDRVVGGRPVREESLSSRRTLYLAVDRGQLPGLFRAFDFANPDLHTPSRHETLVPQQALFLLNSPFVIAQARALARRVDASRPVDEGAWVLGAYRATLGRAPATAERALALSFLAASARLKNVGPERPIDPWRYGYGA